MRQEISLTLILLVIIVTAIVLGQYSPNPQPKTSQSAIPGKEIKATIEVYNGNGSTGVAGKVADNLRKNGFDVRKIDNMKNQTYAKTLVFSRKSEDIKVAQAVAEKLGVNNPFFLESDVEETNDIKVILGDSYKEIK